MQKWWRNLVSNQTLVQENLPVVKLVEEAIRLKSGQLSETGALVFSSGKFTGRAANDKYVVKDNYSDKVIDWTGNVNAMSQENYDKIKEHYLSDLKKQKQLFIEERSAGADAKYAMGVTLITTSPVHSLFVKHLLREPLDNYPLGTFTIYHAPNLELPATNFNLKSSTAIIINFEAKEIIIAGTCYAGEIKKSVFSVMNTLLPDYGILPMHAGANVDESGDVSVFFGLSGTGKTTLSTDKGKKLVGDDEIGFSSEGIFNIEGGCYAKTYKLKKTDEPQIFQAANQFGSLMENVVMDSNGQINFDDKTITENGRSSYPLTALSDFETTGVAKTPKHIFFLSADATGVLPPVSLLTSEQAMYYFLSGYTAKLGGTELGVVGVQKTFSHCFGAPFMMRRPQDYSRLLEKLIKETGANVWLINTGWSGGPYGVGKRFDLEITRSIIRGIQSGEISRAGAFMDLAILDLRYPCQPLSLNKYNNPRKLWADAEAYDKAAEELKLAFAENYKKFEK